jgi:hypothetical protein
MSMIKTNPSVLSEPTVRLFMTRLRQVSSQPINPLSATLLDTEYRTSVDVGVGVLPLVWKGSVWQNGRRIDEGVALQTRKVEVDTSAAREILFSASVAGGNSQRLVPATQFPLGQEAWAVVRNAPLVALPFGGDPYGILIPSIELFRFYYIHSSSSARALMHGLYDSLLLSHEVLEKPEGHEVIVKLNWRSRTDDAWNLARYVRSGLMKSAVLNLHQWIMASNAGRWDKSNALVGSTVFPFLGRTKLSANGVTILGDDGKSRILVTRLLRCTHPMPYDKVSVLVRDKTQGTGKDHESTLPVYFSRWPNGVVPETSSFGNDEEVDRNMFQTYLEANEERFEVLKGKKLNKIKEEPGQKTRHVAAIFEKDKKAMGTSKGFHSDSERAPSEITQRTAVESDTDISLENFLNALKYIRGKGLEVTTIGLGNNVSEVRGENISSFPKLGRSRRQWSVMTDTAGEQRRLVVAKVRKSDKYAYLFEIERDTLRSGDKYSVLVMAARDYSELPLEALLAEVMSCAQHRGWKKEEESRDYLKEFAQHRFRNAKANDIKEHDQQIADATLGERIYSALTRLYLIQGRGAN